jgi:hypothetical protein
MTFAPFVPLREAILLTQRHKGRKDNRMNSASLRLCVNDWLARRVHHPFRLGTSPPGR